MTDENVINAIQRKIESLNLIKTKEEFNNWQNTAVSMLINIYDENDKRVKSIENIKSYEFKYTRGTDLTTEAKSQAKSILQGLIDDISDFGVLKKNKHSENGVSILVNQNNSQIQSTTIQIQLELIIESLNQGLSEVQIQALKEILESNLEPKEKKKSFVNKIKSFGSDVASNILANLLTNPEVYNQLGRML